MCGRFALTEPPRFEPEALQHQSVHVPEQLLADFRPRYNIAPGTDIFVWRGVDGAVTLARHRWGLVPGWAKDVKIGYKLINARSETASVKPAFRDAWRRRRCLIPASGFFEWKSDGRRKRPFYIRLQRREPFAFAGLWEVWRSRDGVELFTCTVLTTEPNALVAEIHDRMPVILPPEAYADWLDPGADAVRLKALMRPFPADAMEAYEVSTLVNSPANDSPACIEPV